MLETLECLEKARHLRTSPLQPSSRSTHPEHLIPPLPRPPGSDYWHFSPQSQEGAGIHWGRSWKVTSSLLKGQRFCDVQTTSAKFVILREIHFTHALHPVGLDLLPRPFNYWAFCHGQPKMSLLPLSRSLNILPNPFIPLFSGTSISWLTKTKHLYTRPKILASLPY